MKKKSIVVLGLSALLLVACGGNSNNNASNNIDNSENVTSQNEVESKEEITKEPNLIGGEEKGTGKIYLVNQSGTTEDGNVIWIQEGDYQLLQIGINSEGMDGSQPTVIYVDGKEIASLQLGDSQNSLELIPEQLTTGVHNVEAIQGDTFYHLMQYEVK